MSHLTPDELVDAAEGGLHESRTLHLASCEVCRLEAASLAALLSSLRSARVSEEDQAPPSPLFWPQFEARVRRATAALDVRAGASWHFAAWRYGLAASVAAAAVWTAVWVTRPDLTNMPVPATVVVTEISVPQPFPAPTGRGPIEDLAPAPSRNPTAGDDSWRKIVELSSALRSDDADTVAPASADAVAEIDGLSQRQLREFLRLLRAETGGM